MSKSRNNYWVSPKGGLWKAQREKSQRAAGVFDTQKEAENLARKILQNSGGGSLSLKGQLEQSEARTP
jgi:hypothetical protein